MTTLQTIILISAVVLVSCLALPLFRKTKKTKRFSVICPKGLFTNVKRSYAAGKRVKIYFPYVATDTDYRFFLNGERFSNYVYSDRKGYVFNFVMPPNDVELTFQSKNSMENPHQTFDEIVTLVNYTECIGTADGDEMHRVTIESTNNAHEHNMSVCNTDGSKKVYIIPTYAYDSLSMYAAAAGLKSWNSLEEYECLDGMTKTFTVLVDQEYITISTDKMPKDNESVFNYIHSILTEYMTKDYEQ